MARSRRKITVRSTTPEAVEDCPLCERPIPPGSRASRHHLVPRLKGGTHLGTTRLHQICHSAIHSRFTETELARELFDIESLRADPQIAKFLAWVRKKPNDFYVATRRANNRTAKWKS